MSRALTRKLLCSAILATLTAGQAGWAMGSGRPPSCAAAPGVVVKAVALDRICAAFDRATHHGENMGHAQQLLAAAVDSVVGKSAERADFTSLYFCAPLFYCLGSWYIV